MSAYAPLVDLAALAPEDGYLVLGPNRGAASGWSVTAADFNRDHIADLLIGSPVAGGSPGAAHVVLGSKAPAPGPLDLAALGAPAGFAITGARIETNLGTGGAAGDLNGDGVEDLVVAA